MLPLVTRATQWHLIDGSKGRCHCLSRFASKNNPSSVAAFIVCKKASTVQGWSPSARWGFSQRFSSLKGLSSLHQTSLLSRFPARASSFALCSGRPLFEDARGPSLQRPASQQDSRRAGTSLGGNLGDSGVVWSGSWRSIVLLRNLGGGGCAAGFPEVSGRPSRCLLARSVRVALLPAEGRVTAPLD